MKVSNTSQRLKEIMNKKGLKQIDILHKIKPLCEKYNIKMGSNDLSQYVTGKVEPSQKKLSVLAELLDVNEVWLMGYDVLPDRDIGLSKNGEPLKSDQYYIIPTDIEEFDLKKGDSIKGKDIIALMSFTRTFNDEYIKIIDRFEDMIKEVKYNKNKEDLLRLYEEFEKCEKEKRKLDKEFSKLCKNIGIKKED